MAEPGTRPTNPRLARSVAAMALLGIVAATCAGLGRWQLERAQLRRDLQHTIAQGRARPALTLAPDTPAAALQDWRTARAHGAWCHDLTVLIENRNQDGRPGYWVATPLVFDSADDGACAGSPAAVLVLRGWLPRRFDAALPDVPAPLGVQRIHGQLLSRVPRIYELPSLWGKARDSRSDARSDNRIGMHVTAANVRAPAVPVVTNLTLEDATRITGLTLLPVVLQQLPDAAGNPEDGLVRAWAGPSLDADKNVGYAIQWFSFAVIALTAALVVAWRTWRRARRAADLCSNVVEQ